jgi:hypothetical protein
MAAMKNSFYMQHMLLQYGRQLTIARRLARHRQIMGLAGGRGAGDPPEVRRNAMVERISAEIVDNLFLTGSDNPVVHEIRERLNNALGERFSFRYPPGELTIQVFRERPTGPEEVSPEEKNVIMERIWTITRETVDATML